MVRGNLDLGAFGALWLLFWFVIFAELCLTHLLDSFFGSVV